MKTIFTFFFLFLIGYAIAQTHTKTIIVPQKFSIFKENNQFNTSFLTKSFFEKEGFTVFLDGNNLPPALANNRCSAFFVDLQEENTLFITKLTVFVKDCRNNILATSTQGKSRNKDNNKAYNEALRMALKSLEGQTNFENKITDNEAVIKAVEIEKEEEIVENKVAKTEEIVEKTTSKTTLISEPTKSGYMLRNENNSIVFELFKTSNPTIFIAKKGNTNGIFTLKNNFSTFESYQNGELKVENVSVSF